MFRELIVQIQHQYGKYLVFDNAYTDSKESIYGMTKDFFEDETIVEFIPKKGGFQIKHQYGKYLNFDYAYTKSKQKVYGMSKDFHEDETIVHIIPRDGGYQIRHIYGKYLNFDYAYTNNKEQVYGMNDGFHVDETIVHFIPVKYDFVIAIENFDYNLAPLSNNQLRKKPSCLIRKTFTNNSNVEQHFDVRENKTYGNRITFEHESQDVRTWLNRISVGVNIKANSAINLPLAGEIGYEYSWSKQSLEKFNTSTTKSVEHSIEVKDQITVSPHHEMTYMYIKNSCEVAIPYTAKMKISCKVDGSYISDEALKFILDYVGRCPNGNVTKKNRLGIYTTTLEGTVTLDAALDFQTQCDEQPIRS